MGFTAEELDSMRLADAEIEATFCITADEIKESRDLDRQIKMDGMDAKKRKIAAYQAEYRAANREKIAAYQAEYRAEHRDEYNAYMREYMREYRKRKGKKK
jgi:hypothetical protein